MTRFRGFRSGHGRFHRGFGGGCCWLSYGMITDAEVSNLCVVHALKDKGPLIVNVLAVGDPPGDAGFEDLSYLRGEFGGRVVALSHETSVPVFY